MPSWRHLSSVPSGRCRLPGTDSRPRRCSTTEMSSTATTHPSQPTPARVELYDEWLSTREAAGRLRAQGLNAKQQRGRIDSASAAILLQSWLDRAAGGTASYAADEGEGED